MAVAQAGQQLLFLMMINGSCSLNFFDMFSNTKNSVKFTLVKTQDTQSASTASTAGAASEEAQDFFLDSKSRRVQTRNIVVKFWKRLFLRHGKVNFKPSTCLIQQRLEHVRLMTCRKAARKDSGF